MNTQPTAKHREEAREMVQEFESLRRSRSLTDVEVSYQHLEFRIAARLAARDAETREVLEGLRVYWTDGGCWCRNKKYRPRIHDAACLAVRGLWERVQGEQQ